MSNIFYFLAGWLPPWLISHVLMELKHFLPLGCLPKPPHLLFVWSLFYIFRLLYSWFFPQHFELLFSSPSFTLFFSLSVYVCVCRGACIVLLAMTLLICSFGDVLWMPLHQKIFTKCHVDFLTSQFPFKSLFFIILEALHAICFNVFSLSTQCLLRRFIEMVT